MEKKELTLSQKLNKIQVELKAPKGQYNSFGKYKYRSCEDILDSLKGLLDKYECSVILADEIVAVGDRFYIKATAKLMDDTYEINTTAFAREELTKKGMDGSQITGTASSYARKYALNGLFAIDDTKDADTDENKKEQSKKAKEGKEADKKTDYSGLEKILRNSKDLKELQEHFLALSKDAKVALNNVKNEMKEKLTPKTK